MGKEEANRFSEFIPSKRKAQPISGSGSVSDKCVNQELDGCQSKTPVSCLNNPLIISIVSTENDGRCGPRPGTN